MNNKGLAISGILYTILLIFVISLTMMLFNLQNRKTILDELKMDAVDAVDSDVNYEYLLNELNKLKEQLGTKDIHELGDGTVTGTLISQNDSLLNASKNIDKINTNIKNINDNIAFGRLGMTISTEVELSYSDFFKIGDTRYMVASTHPKVLDLAANTPTWFGDLRPEDFPIKNVSVPCVFTNNEGKLVSWGRYQIRTDGKVYITSYNELTKNTYFVNATAVYRVK